MDIHGLRTIIVAEQVLTGSVESGIFLEIVGPIRYSYGIAGFLGGFDRILIDGGVNQPKIIDDLGSLGAFAGPQESGNSDGGEQGNDLHYNHDFHESEAPASGFEFLKHN